MEALKKSWQALEVCEQIADFQALVYGVIVDSPTTCRAVVEGGDEALPLVVLRYVVTGPDSAAAAIDSSVLEEPENELLAGLLAQQEGRSCCDIFFAVSAWIAQRHAVERSATGLSVTVEESSEDDSSLKDSRMGQPDTRGDAPEFRRTLAGLAAKSLGDNLLLFEGLEEVPLGVKGRIFEYLIKSRTLSSAKLNVLVTAELTRMNLSGPCRDLIRDVHCGIIARASGMKKLNLEGCSEIGPEGWSALSALNKLEDLNVSNTNVTDDFVNQLSPTVRMANFSNCPQIKASLYRFVQRSNRLVELDISGCGGVPWSVCASMLALFWPSFRALRAANSGDLTGTVRSGESALSVVCSFELILAAHRRSSCSCKCRECVVEAVILCELPQLRNAQCNGVTFDLTNCGWIAASIFPSSCSFPHAQQVKFGTQVDHGDAWAFALLCPQLRNLELSCSERSAGMFTNGWTGSRLLTEVTLGACSFATADWLARFFAELPLVEKITLIRVPELSLQRAVNIVSHRESLKYLHLEGFQVGWEPFSVPRHAHALSYLKLAGSHSLTTDLMAQLCLSVFPGSDTVVLRGTSKVDALSFLHHDTTALTLDCGCAIPAPLDLLLFGPPLRLRTLQLLDWNLHELISPEAQQRINDTLTVHPHLVSLDIARGFVKFKSLLDMRGKELVLSVLFRMFPNLKLFTARHQLRELLNLPKLPTELKTLSLCLLDQVDGTIPKKKIYRATCAACEAAGPDDAMDDDLGFNLFD